MGNLTINGEDFAPLASGINLGSIETGQYHGTGGIFGKPPWAGRPVYEEMDITFAGLDGVGKIRLGFRERPIVCHVVFAGSPEEAEAARDAFLLSASQNERYTITLPGGSSFDGCRLVANGDVEWQNVATKKGVYIVPLVFAQFSTEN